MAYLTFNLNALIIDLAVGSLNLQQLSLAIRLAEAIDYSQFF